MSDRFIREAGKSNSAATAALIYQLYIIGRSEAARYLLSVIGKTERGAA